MDVVYALQEALDSAQSELAAAEVALLEATARANSARESAARLESAVAALNGSSPPPAAKPRKKDSNNPLADVKCQGCGSIGKMAEQVVAAPSGTTVRMLVCGNCGNQVL